MYPGKKWKGGMARVGEKFTRKGKAHQSAPSVTIKFFNNNTCTSLKLFPSLANKDNSTYLIYFTYFLGRSKEILEI